LALTSHIEADFLHWAWYLSISQLCTTPERWLNVEMYVGHFLCQAVEFTEFTEFTFNMLSNRFFQVFFGEIKWNTSKMCFGTVAVQPVLVRYPINNIEAVPIC
jgi:hypothetical protein